MPSAFHHSSSAEDSVPVEDRASSSSATAREVAATAKESFSPAAAVLISFCTPLRIPRTGDNPASAISAERGTLYSQPYLSGSVVSCFTQHTLTPPGEEGPHDPFRPRQQAFR